MSRPNDADPRVDPTRYVAPGGRMDALVRRPPCAGSPTHGISLMGSRVLVVRGRTSGEPRSNPVNLLELDGERYLVAPRGNTQWVRNARAAGTGRAAPRAAQRAGQPRRAAGRGPGAGAAGLPQEVGLGGRPVRRGPVQEVDRRRDRRGGARGCRCSGYRSRRLTAQSGARGGCRGSHLSTRPRGRMARVGAVSDALVHRADDDRIAVLTLDSPANRNALSRRLVADLAEHLAEAGADESLHGVLLRSSHPVFCAGADLKEAATVDMVESARGIIALQRAIAALPVPVVCRLDGPVRAGGLGLVASSRHRRLPRRRHLRPHRGAPRARRGGHLDPAAGPAQPARGIRLVPHRALGRRRRGARRRAWSPTSCPPTRWMPWPPGCSTTCAPVLARAWSRPSGCSTPTSSRPSTSAATRWPGSAGCSSTRRRAGADGGGAAPLSRSPVGPGVSRQRSRVSVARGRVGVCRPTSSRVAAPAAPRTRHSLAHCSIVPPYLLEALASPTTPGRRARAGDPRRRRRAAAGPAHRRVRPTAPRRAAPRQRLAPGTTAGPAARHPRRRAGHHAAGHPGALRGRPGHRRPGGHRGLRRARRHLAALAGGLRPQLARRQGPAAGRHACTSARNYDNAFWDGTQMVFGDGDGVIFLPFTRSVDVIGHELAHGVTQYTSGLNYQDQSGALNESVSDVFGVLVKQRLLGQTADQADWLVGAELLAPGVNGVALRSMAAPGTAYDDPRLGKDPQPGAHERLRRHHRRQRRRAHQLGHPQQGVPRRRHDARRQRLGGRRPGLGRHHHRRHQRRLRLRHLRPAHRGRGHGPPRRGLRGGRRGPGRLGGRGRGLARSPHRPAPPRLPPGTRPGPAPSPGRRARGTRTTPGPATEVSLRRTGGIAGRTLERTVVLGELPNGDARAWRSLLADDGLPALADAVAGSATGPTPSATGCAARHRRSTSLLPEPRPARRRAQPARAHPRRGPGLRSAHDRAGPTGADPRRLRRDPAGADPVVGQRHVRPPQQRGLPRAVRQRAQRLDAGRDRHRREHRPHPRGRRRDQLPLLPRGVLPRHRRGRGARQPAGSHQRAVRVRRLPARRRADRGPRAVGPGLRRPGHPAAGPHPGCRARPPRGRAWPRRVPPRTARSERAPTHRGRGRAPSRRRPAAARLARPPTRRRRLVGPGRPVARGCLRRGRRHRAGAGVGPRPGQRCRPRLLAPRRLGLRPRPARHDPSRRRGRLGRRARCRAPRRGDRRTRAVARHPARPARTTPGCATRCRSAATCRSTGSTATTTPCSRWPPASAAWPSSASRSRRACGAPGSAPPWPGRPVASCRPGEPVAACVSPANVPSLRALLSAGFEPVGSVQVYRPAG